MNYNKSLYPGEDDQKSIKKALINGFLLKNLHKDKCSLSSFMVDFEKDIISKALNVTNGCKKHAALLLDVNYTTLVEKIKKWDIEIPRTVFFEDRI